MTLYEMPEAMLEILDMQEDENISEEQIQEELTSLLSDLDNKAEGYVKIMQQLKADVNQISDEITRLQARKKSLNNNIDRMKESLASVMSAMGRKKIQTPLYTLTVAKKPPHVVIDVQDDIPESFWKPQDPKLDQAALKKYLKEEGDQPYAHLEADMGLRIK